MIKRVEQIIRAFLWKGPTLNYGGAKVAWKDLACPTEEGGLGIRGIEEWNMAAMSKHIWRLCQPSITSSWA